MIMWSMEKSLLRVFISSEGDAALYLLIASFHQLIPAIIYARARPAPQSGRVTRRNFAIELSVSLPLSDVCVSSAR